MTYFQQGGQLFDGARAAPPTLLATVTTLHTATAGALTRNTTALAACLHLPIACKSSNHPSPSFGALPKYLTVYDSTSTVPGSARCTDSEFSWQRDSHRHR